MEPQVASANEEAVGAWDGVLFDRFSQFRHLILPGLGAASDRALELYPPAAGERVLDVGCGFGDTAREIAQMVGPEGEAVGVDASPRFIEAATAESAEAGVDNARYAVADVEAGGLEDGFDRAFSRMGTMFFANPAAALRHVREALRPGGELVSIVWRQKPDNPWVYSAEQAVEQWLERNEDSDEPTCGPGPFSMANADTVSGILVSAGYEDIGLSRCDTEFLIGRDLDEAVAYVTALGPAAEIVRLARPEDLEQVRAKVMAAVSEALERHVDDDGGVRAQMSSWIIHARNHS